MAKTNMEVGIVGAGIGGLLAAIAIARGGGSVTVLEAASQLGEIGAGIQMTPNVARLLVRYGIDKVIGKNLVRFDELNLRRRDGTKVGYSKLKRVEDALGWPWWLVHRHHLHQGLVEVARRSGVRLVVDSRVVNIAELRGGRVSLATNKGQVYEFDLLVGADGVGSIVRKHLFPDVNPRPPDGMCAYRAIVPIDEIRRNPVTRELVEDELGRAKRTMEVWMSPTGYIITYPISDGKEFNMVLSHFRDPPVRAVQDVALDEVRQEYQQYDPRIQKVIEMIPDGVRRWPLLVTGPLQSWSNAEKSIVLIGDAAHSMVNHMAQGAATSMEDGAFLARCLTLVTDGRGTLADAVSIYEKGRMPKATYKQQISFLNGWLWTLPDGPAQDCRDRLLEAELNGVSSIRSPNLYSDPIAILECYGYDAETHADEEISSWLNGPRVVRDIVSTVTQQEADKLVNWFLPAGAKFQISPKL